MSTEPKAPVKEFRAGTVRAAVWRNEDKVGDRTVIRHSVRIEKRFHDKKKDEWRTSDYLFANDLPRLCLVAERAFEYITLHESEEA